MNDLFFIFDCESVGLHGESFAAGFVLINRAGDELKSGRIWCDPDFAEGNADGLLWVKENVPVEAFFRDPATIMLARPRHVRQAFWEHLDKAMRKGATVWADCGWPVEARFLSDCMKDDPTRSPVYPLHDLATLIWSMGFDPTATFGRLESEKPAHDPLCDARQSARVLVEMLRRQADYGLELRNLRGEAGGTMQDANLDNIIDRAIGKVEPAEDAPVSSAD